MYCLSIWPTDLTTLLETHTMVELMQSDLPRFSDYVWH